MTTRRKLQATKRTRSQAGNNREGQSDDLARRLDYLNRTRHNHWDYSALLYLKEIRVHLFVAKEVCRMIYRIVSSLRHESQSTKRIDFSNDCSETAPTKSVTRKGKQHNGFQPEGRSAPSMQKTRQSQGL